MQRSSRGNSQADPEDRDRIMGTRRDALRLAGGGATLAALATVGFGNQVRAQYATPVAAASREGAYAVMRTRTIKPDKSIDDLNAAVRAGFVPITRQIQDYIDYYIVQNFQTRERT